jgi:hypothetical protein
MKIAAITLITPLLASCAIPGAVGLAGLALEGGSIVSTGKSATDLAISAATERDCHLLSGLTKGRLCADDKIAVTAAKARGQLPEKSPQRAVARVLTPRARVDNKWTLLIGTFSELGGATKRAGLARPGKASISSDVTGGKVVYRVTVGSFPFEDAQKQRATVGGPGIDKIAVLRVCPSWMKDESCISLDRVIMQSPKSSRRAGL